MNIKSIPSHEACLDTSLRWYDEIGSFLNDNIWQFISDSSARKRESILLNT